MKIYSFVFALLFVVGCAPKVLILQSPVLSMNKKDTAKGVALKEGKEVTSKWCTGDAPVVENDDGSKDYGMIDQALHKAHKEHKTDYFMGAKVYQQTTCIIIQANAATGGGGGGGDEADNDDGKKAKKAVKKKKA